MKSEKSSTRGWILAGALAVGAAAAFGLDNSSPGVRPEPEPPHAATEPAPPRGDDPAAMPPGHPPVAEEGSAPAQAAQPAVAGTVREVLQVASYSYLRIDSPDGEVWAAVPKQPSLKPGDKVAVRDAALMQDFKSAELGRTFASIYFGTLSGGAPGAGEAPPANPHGAAAAASIDGAPVARATGDGAHTVSEIVRQKDLAGKKVRVAGRVVKLTAAVLGRNWLHLQDGTGTAAGKDNDLVVTTAATPSVGDVVLVVGTVQRDKDLGSGYRYDVLIEDAEVQAQPK